MPALTAARNTSALGLGIAPKAVVLPVAASTVVYQGGLVALNASGFAVPASANPSLRVVGVASANADNASGAAGAITVKVERGCFWFENSSSVNAITDGDCGRPCYVVDDNTVTRGSTRLTRCVAGIVHEVDASKGVAVIVGSDFGPDGEDELIPAGAALATAFTAVTLDSNGKVIYPGSAGVACIGVLQAAVADTDAMAIVRVRGRTRVVANQTVSAGYQFLAAVATSGKVKPAVAAAVNTSDAGGATDAVIGSHVLGFTYLAAAAATDETIVMTVHPVGSIPTTAA